MKIRIILTGTGAGELPYIGEHGKILHRHDPNALIITDTDSEKHHIHIDFTPFAADGLIKAKVPSSKISTLFLSHAHEDHFDVYRWLATKLNIGDVRFNFDLKFNETVMNIYGPKPVIKALVEMLSNKNCYYHSLTKSKENICYSYKNKGKEVLLLRGVEKSSLITVGPCLQVRCIGVTHQYDSVISTKGTGNTTFGFLIIVKEQSQQFCALYLTDFEHFRPKELFKKSIAGYNIDLCILGMPVPFPEKQKKKKHLCLEETLKFFKLLQNDGLIKEKSPIVLTHLSDRWENEEVLENVKKVIQSHWTKKNIWIPKKDGFEIIYENGKLKKKGRIIKLK